MSINQSSSDQSVPAVIFTAAAADKVKNLIDEEGNPDLNLRIGIVGGGCSGFKYEFSFDTIRPDDIAIEKNSVKLLIDPLSFGYLQNAKVDYRSGLDGEQFVISNPNSKTTCGCGSSFSA